MHKEGMSVSVMGGDLTALLFGWRLLKRGVPVTIFTDKPATGVFGSGPGRFCVHEGYDPHLLEQTYGHAVASDFLAYRQFVLDELEQDLMAFPHGVSFTEALGVHVAHDPRGMLALRERHEAQNRHGALRSWGTPALHAPHDSLARLVSLHEGNRFVEAGALMEVLVQAIRALGGRVVFEKEAQGVQERGETFSVSFLAPESTARVWETFVRLAPQTIQATSRPTWYRNQYPMFDWAQKREDGSWVLGSRRSWSTQQEGSAFPRDHAWLHLGEPTSVSKHQRYFGHVKKLVLPSVSSEEHHLKVLGVEQEDAVMDLLAVDLALRAFFHQPEIFGKALGALPRQGDKQGMFSRFVFPSMLDDALAQDLRARSV